MKLKDYVKLLNDNKIDYSNTELMLIARAADTGLLDAMEECNGKPKHHPYFKNMHYLYLKSKEDSLSVEDYEQLTADKVEVLDVTLLISLMFATALDVFKNEKDETVKMAIKYIVDTIIHVLQYMSVKIDKDTYATIAKVLHESVVQKVTVMIDEVLKEYK